METVVSMNQKIVKLTINLTGMMITDNNLPSVEGWSKYNFQLDFVKFNLHLKVGSHHLILHLVRLDISFMLFFTSELIKEFTKNTNEYAK